MKKRIITLILSVLTLALLAGAYFLVTNLEENDTSENESTTDNVVSYYVSQIDRSSLYSMGFTYDGNSFDLTLKEDGTGWTLKGKEHLPISNVAVALMVQNFETMTTDFMIESPSEEKLKEYGFDTPTAKMYFYDKNGRHGFEIGVLNSFNSMYYVRASHDNQNVYLVHGDFMDDFKLGEMDLLEIQDFPTVSLTKEINLSLKTENDVLNFKFYPSGKSGHFAENSNWFLSINSNPEFPINEDIAKRLSEAVKYLGFAECISYDEKDIDKYGLTNPINVSIEYTSVLVETDSETGTNTTTETKEKHSFQLGNRDEDGFNYAKTDSSPLIYVTVSDIWSELCEFNRDTLTDIATGFVFNINTDEISEVSFVFDGKDHILKIEEDAIGVNYTVDGKKIQKSVAENFIKTFASLPWDTDKTKESASTAENLYLSIEIKSENSSSKASFTSFSDKFFGVTLDFSDKLLISSTKIEKITTAIEDLLK